MLTLELSEVYEKAANEVEKRGHCKGILQDGQGRICTLYALCLGAGVDLFYTAPSPAAVEAMNRTVLDPFMRAVGRDVCGWNNDESRTKESIVATLRSLAQSARVSEAPKFLPFPERALTV